MTTYITNLATQLHQQAYLIDQIIQGLADLEINESLTDEAVAELKDAFADMQNTITAIKSEYSID